MFFILLTILFFIFLLIIAYKYFKLQSFVSSFCYGIQQLNLTDNKLNINNVPKILAPLYRTVNELLSSMTLMLTRDKLTNLPNSLDIKDFLAEQLPSPTGFLVLVDICQFRYINDYFGFEIGDALLQKLSFRLSNLNIDIIRIAKMGDDEFLLYLACPLSKKQLLEIKNMLEQAFTIKKVPIILRLQFGCLDLSCEQTYSSASQIFSLLELALKKSKNNKESIGFYCQQDAITRQRELSLIHGLPKGLRADEFYLVFQPKLEVNTGGCIQVEALMRWNSPEFNAVSPVEFIPLAEYTGMIELVSRWTLNKVLQQQVKWRAMGLNIQVAVNLSTRDLTSPTLCQEIKAQLQYYQLPSEVLVIEITESTLMADIKNGVNTLRFLRQLGIKLAIDDFGTGHSSLAYLKHLPIDEVKIDKAFIEDLLTDLHAAHIMETSIMLAKKLGLEVTVEGVETKEIKDLLIFMGVDKIQGDLFSPPLTLDELEVFWPAKNHPKK